MFKHVFLTGPPGTSFHLSTPYVPMFTKINQFNSIVQLSYCVKDVAGSQLVLCLHPD